MEPAPQGYRKRGVSAKLQSTSAKPDGCRVHISEMEPGNGPVTRVEDTSKLKRLVREEREEGRGPEREVCESWTNTKEGGREEIVKARFVLLKSWRMVREDRVVREREIFGEFAFDTRLLEGRRMEDTSGGSDERHSMPYQSQ